MDKKIQEYCIGCGLCQSLGKAKLNCNQKGYLYPVDGDVKWLRSVCPAGGTQCTSMDFNHIWGRAEAVYYGYSTDAALRKKASSGGALTEIAAYLLENKKVDAILHTCASSKNPTETEICISTSRDELVSRCGSRYAISHPLSSISILDANKKYAFIGKPCDVTALKNFQKMNPGIAEMIPITMSFFCAGLPSIDAQKKLLKEMGCDGRVVSLRYRGNGWPGYATATQEDGKQFQMDYNTSWGKILGRDIMKMCRFCLDGIGEMADIACCDAWYLTEDNKPDFTEAEGRNGIFCRSKLGVEIVREASTNGKLAVTEFVDYEEKLKYMQFYQRDRRATMLTKYAAMKICLKPFPKYPMKVRKYQKGVGIRRCFRIFKGTVGRVLKGKI